MAKYKIPYFKDHVEVEIPDGKTVSVETLNGIGTSVKYRLDPDERTIQ